MSTASCGCGTIESGPHRMRRTFLFTTARRINVARWVANMPSMKNAQMRWMRPASSNPPSRRASVPAQGLSENSSGSPVSAQPTNVSMSTE